MVAAARELAAETGGPAGVAAPAPVAGVLPPRASSTGRRYYLLVGGAAGLPGPLIACGQELALVFLGGSWLGHGTAPRGFADLLDAANAAAALGHPGCRVYWTDPR